MVHENYNKALSRDAVREGKFYFRSFDKDYGGSDNFKLMSVAEIVNGDKKFCGLVGLVRRYLDGNLLGVEVKKVVDRYLSLISETASGRRQTVARRIREFVHRHPEYKHDSFVTEKIQYDLIKWLNN